MKILYVIDSLCGGGAEKLVHDLMPLVASSHTCDLLLLSDRDDKYSESLKKQGIKISVSPHKGMIKTLLYIKKYIKLGNYDIVHANLFPSFYYCSLIKKISGKVFPKLVMTEHNTDNRRRHKNVFRVVEKWIYSSYDHVISISDATQKALLEWLEIAQNDKFSVIKNGIPMDIFTNAIPYDRDKLFEMIKPDDIILCMVGSFTEQKNHGVIIEMLYKLPTCYKLILVGEGKLEKEIKKLVIERQLEDRIRFLGFRNDVPSIMKTADVIVIPSKWEGFGLIAVEAMACGKTIVASKVPGLDEVIGEAGYKVSKYMDQDCFAEVVVEAVNHPIDKAILCRQASYYSIENMCSNYIKIYKQLIE